MFKKTLTAMVAMIALATFSAPTFANKLYSESYGSWELMAWSNNNHFCALKTYVGDKTFAIRQSSEGMTLVVTDPNVAFLPGEAEASVYFDGNYWGSGTERTYRKWRTQVFIDVAPSDMDDFMSHVITAGSIQFKSSDVDYNLNLIGTEVLGGKLDDCVRAYGF